MAKPLVVLGLEPDATWEQIRARYRQLVAQHHPDRNGDVDQFRRIQLAYETLRQRQEQKGAFDDIFTDVQKDHRGNACDG